MFGLHLCLSIYFRVCVCMFVFVLIFIRLIAAHPAKFESARSVRSASIGDGVAVDDGISTVKVRS